MTKPQAPAEIDPNAFSLEFLMSVLPDDLTKIELSQVVQYHRNVRADRAAAASPKSRSRSAAPAAVPDAIAKLIKSRKPSVKLSRRGL